MQTFKIAAIRTIQADSAEEAAMLMYQELSKEAAPLRYTVLNGSDETTEITLDRREADEFASVDHTADPGNW